MRLSALTQDRLAASVARPGYDRQAQACGIVHLGLGAFHRAHQAVYTDDAMAAGDRDWGVVGVSMRSADVRDALEPQDGLYTVSDRDGSGETVRLIGAVQRLLVAPEAPEAVVAAMADPAVQVVTLTVTEKGYHRAPGGGLAPRLGAAEMDRPTTIHGFMAAGLARRRAAGLPGLSVISCDNLAGNGAQTAALLDEFLERVDAGLAAWTRAECAFPSTMVDRIVPAATPARLDATAARLGLRDEAAVTTEPFRQWVIEDRFAGPRPRWEAGGAEFVSDVGPYETAKLRMLNGAHSALAYLGLRRGHVFVHEAVADPSLRALVDRLMRIEAPASFAPAPGQDLDAYADALLARFANPALAHRLSQIAMDGSQKIPQRWLETLQARQDRGETSPAIVEALAGWALHVRGDNGPVDDPAADDLKRLWREAGADGIAAALLGPAGFLGANLRRHDEVDAVRDALVRLMTGG
ncbi:mannitol dehydrogenase family protein [Brevundimonas sp.]|uniref:mannitol dehydrogenase family protein n=1 Tax=Brevundimonas sp. TaxID=1871086 RepID=UPI002FCC0D93